MNMQLQGLDNFDWGKIATGLTDVVKQATPVVLAAKQQKDLQKLNVERAKQGPCPPGYGRLCGGLRASDEDSGRAGCR